MTYVLLCLANIVAGTINALAGGGGLITFPLLMLTFAPVTADATSAVALFFAYPAALWRTRSQLDGVFGHGWLWLLLVPCVLGGVVGAVLLSRTGNRNFIEFVPWLVLIATIIIVWRLFRSRDWHPHDWRAEFYLAGRYPACGRPQKLFDPLHARNGRPRTRT